eukprot:Nk52_evm61s226 gene=Nk52_evmTU61s226
MDYEKCTLQYLQQRTAIMLMLFTGMRDVDCTRINLNKSNLSGFSTGESIRLVIGGAADRDAVDRQTKRQKKTKSASVKGSLDYYDVAPTESLDDNNALHVWHILKVFVTRTQRIRGDSSVLFINLSKKGTRVVPVLSTTVSKWVSRTFGLFQAKELGIDDSHPQFIKVTGHNLRGCARYFMQVAGYSEEEIRTSIGWLSKQVMVNHYTKSDYMKGRVEGINRQGKFEESLCQT